MRDANYRWAEHIALAVVVLAAFIVMAFASLFQTAYRDMQEQWSGDIEAWEDHAATMYARGYEDGLARERLARECR